MLTSRDCPCGSGSVYEDCCKRLHDGEPAASPEALMRSRYSAFVLGLGDYLQQSHHPETCPADGDLPDQRWIKLEVIKAVGQQVTFRAWFEVDGRLGVMQERSRFEQIQGRWLYHSGDFLPAEPVWPRNEACWCGSGRKAKKCHPDDC